MTDAPREWTPRFKLYAKSQGMTPEQVLERDREKWPGGCMTGYVLWNSEMLQAYMDTLPKPTTPLWTKRDEMQCKGPEFIDAWIEKRLEASRPA